MLVMMRMLMSVKLLENLFKASLTVPQFAWLKTHTQGQAARNRMDGTKKLYLMSLWYSFNLSIAEDLLGGRMGALRKSSAQTSSQQHQHWFSMVSQPPLVLLGIPSQVVPTFYFVFRFLFLVRSVQIFFCMFILGQKQIVFSYIWYKSCF